MNVQLMAKIYIGSNLQPFNMIFDTGSNILWVNSRVCSNCPFYISKFDERTSDTFSFYNVVFDLHYGTGDVYGYSSQDQVCFDEDFCSPKFKFINVGYQKDLGGLRCSGVVGMSPYTTDDNGDLFVEKLHKDGVIDEAVFALYISLVENKSKISLGGYDLE